jgi:mevalonate kinase
MGKGSGFGKVILFNEHFVVHGVPSIASAIEMETTAVVEAIQSKNTWALKDERKATPGYKEDKKDQQADSIDNIFRAMGLTAKNVRITLGGSLTAASGVGASAASCVAIARALNDEFKLNLPDERINEIAFEGEKGYHGTPSGIDNTVATFGSLIWYKRDMHGTVMEKIKMKMPVEIVMGNSGLVTNTKAAVEGVEKRKAENPAEFAKLFKSAEELAVKARKALENNKIEEVGALMNENHKLLQKIGVSCPKLDSMVELARKNGAIGAKLTGGGLGGYMVALTLGKDVQEKVAKALEKEGYHVLRTRIGIDASN